MVLWYYPRMSDQLIAIKERSAPILKHHHAVEAYVFGSTARDEARAGSDIDILVRFDRTRGLFAFMQTKLDLERALGGKVDLVEVEALRQEFREDVERDRIRIF